MNILVLGASGLVGRHLLDCLSEAGHSVDAVSRNPQQFEARSGTRGLRADLAMPDWITESGIALSQYEVIYHLAYSSRLDEAYNYIVTVDSVRVLMEGLRRIEDSKPRHIVYVGSMAVFGLTPKDEVVTEDSDRVGDTAYARNKIAAAKFASMTRQGLMSTILHPTGVYDETSPRIQTYRQLLSKNYIALRAGGMGTNNIIHAADVACALTQCVQRTSSMPTEEYIINGESISYGSWFSRLASTSTKHTWLQLPRAARLFCRGPVRRIFNAAGIRCPLPVPDYKLAAFEHQVRYNSDKAERHFDFHPRTHFDEFCHRISSSEGRRE
jgi:nucleoside-diphosphate-sugar epimerase